MTLLHEAVSYWPKAGNWESSDLWVVGVPYRYTVGNVYKLLAEANSPIPNSYIEIAETPCRLHAKKTAHEFMEGKRICQTPMR